MPVKRSAPDTVEAALDRDLSTLPENLRSGAIAMGARMLARRIDAGLSPGMLVQAQRELRVTMAKLSEAAPLKESDDKGDELQKRRQKRLREASGG